ncbi:MAG: DegT/DnrJ/EryC1/StrS family aminotransferase [Cyanobacteria bacterium J083]|nr:MAG: DegT/DnrJ/EryC1/StrS family aminotransferase [Cyanobacteria bacterium J083]
MKSAAVKVPFVNLAIQHQPISQEIEQAVTRGIRRGDFVLGKALKEFESEFAQACGVKYGVGVASGTDAITLGLKACGINPGDEILVPANTFIATVIGVSSAGATPVMVDCVAETALIDLEKAAAAITSKTKGIIPVHLYGQMVSPQQLLDFAKTYNLIIFEDAAQAHLASKEGYTAGSVGTAAGFSFYPSKNLGAFGNGGMLVTQNEAIAKRMQALRNYGAPKKYYHTELGINSRLDTLQAAILQVKLPSLAHWNKMRNQAANYYDKLLAPLALQGIKPIKNLSGQGHVYHLYVIRVDRQSGLNRDIIAEKLGERGIQTGIHYPIPCHLQPAYSYLGYQRGDFPQAETLCEEILSLPMYPGLTQAEIELVVQELCSVLNLTTAI